MHTISVICGGLVLLAAAVLIGQFTSLGRARALLGFIPVWLIAAGYNMWVGVTTAGYSVAYEFPIFLVIFLVPAVSALILYWRFAR